ncbi:MULTISPECIES: YcfL family protein [unclassified Photobacterium]|uniref:YcfL family protein n=1 Tax=unclassified Photobacterium TaxID=2628852 RepID=UPI001B8CF9D2|nr:MULTISPECIES: YcfL family protein [unclassified Photobacterium]MDO6707327.1 YcfL family protein [Photobacterium sp. 1_MG-2023]QUJ66289.1 YcfL family protein [Photobacterium sp. GJ3]
MKYVIAICVALLMTACARTTTSGISIDSSNQHVVIANPHLASQIGIEQAAVSRENGLLMAGVPVVSKVDGDIKLQYRFYWYDGKGLEVNGSDSPWRQFVLHGKDTMTIKAMAKTPDAENYRIYIREATTTW